jgi:hypothetical protein
MIDIDILKDIEEFCKLNNIDKGKFINKLIKDSFLNYKYNLYKEPKQIKIVDDKGKILKQEIQKTELDDFYDE